MAATVFPVSFAMAGKACSVVVPCSVEDGDTRAKTFRYEVGDSCSDHDDTLQCSI